MHTIPYGRQDITQEDIDAVVSVLKSDFLTQGPSVPMFEKRLCNITGAGHALAVSSATSALHIACLALGVGPGDRVWTSANTFVASANCALYCGASVDFVDIDLRTYNMCVESLEAKLIKAEHDGKLPKLVIPVHFAGQSCDMHRISELALRFGFRVIEDASHAIGGRYDDAPVGSCKYSDITVFSFHPVKIVTTGEGGAALTNDADLAAVMMRLRTHGITPDKRLFSERPADEIWNYQQVELGFNYRITELQAALGLSQLERLDDFVAKRHELVGRYTVDFATQPVTLPYQAERTYSSYHLYPVLIPIGKGAQSQRFVFDSLHQKGILANLHYIPVYLQPYYSNLGFERGYCANAEEYYRRAVSLPLYPTMSDGDVRRVVAALSEIYS